MSVHLRLQLPHCTQMINQADDNWCRLLTATGNLHVITELEKAKRLKSEGYNVAGILAPSLGNVLVLF